MQHRISLVEKLVHPKRKT